MIDFSQLEQLIAFAEHGTLSKAAEHLHMSQPTLTRAMKRLEDEFGVPLFEHRKNKLTLNENGLLAVEYAQKVLDEVSGMVASVRARDRAEHTISVGSCAPAPLWEVYPLLSNLYPQMTISTEIKNMDVLLSGLHDETYLLVILADRPEDDACRCFRWGEENLYLSLPASHPLAGSEGIYMKEMDGENMLIFSQIGFWHDFTRKKLPHSRFLLQNERFDFFELVNSSVLPSFSSDMVQRYPEQNPSVDRINVPILDAEAHVIYYCCCLKKNLGRLRAFVQKAERRSS